MNAAAPIVVEFAFNEFATVSGTLVTAAPDALTVEFAPDVWEQIDLLQLFHLRWDVRGDGSVSGTGPVQIELRLDPALAADRLRTIVWGDRFATPSPSRRAAVSRCIWPVSTSAPRRGSRPR